MYATHQNFCISKVTEVKEQDGDIRFKSLSGNMAIVYMCKASGHNYSNSLVIVDLAMEQIPRSTERIASWY